MMKMMKMVRMRRRMVVVMMIMVVGGLNVGVSGSMEREIDVHAGNVVNTLERIAECTENTTQVDGRDGGITRVLFTQPDIDARLVVMSEMDKLNLDVRVDAIGNIFGRWQGQDDGGATAMDTGSALGNGAVLTGSHIDAIPLSGKYDGTLGVAAPLEAIRSLQEAGFKPRRSIEVVAFTSEEPTRFGLSCLGSRAMAGKLSVEDAAQLVDADGMQMVDVVRRGVQDLAARRRGDETTDDEVTHSGERGHLEDMLESVRADATERFSSFVELHMEQGPVLEKEGIDLGIVEGIAAPRYTTFTFTGPGGHAGTVLMSVRHDPLIAASQLAVEVERSVLEIGGTDTVATVGKMDISPGAVNSVPRDVTVHLDLRDVDQDRRERVMFVIERKAQSIASTRGVGLSITHVSLDPAMIASQEVLAKIEDAVSGTSARVREGEVTMQRMISRAYHDSTFIGQFVPSAMVFVPCRNGWSHRPDEFVSEDAIAVGTEALARSLVALAGGTWTKADDEL